MIVNNISTINFKENNAENIKRNYSSQNAILMLRDPNASVRFQQNQEFAQNADSVTSNPLKALGYKLYRTFSMIRENDQAPEAGQKQFVTFA